MEEMKNSENLLLSFAPNKRKNGGTRTEKCHTVERGEPINKALPWVKKKETHVDFVNIT